MNWPYFAFAALTLLACDGEAQTPAPEGSTTQRPASTTKMEGFKPAAGTVVTFGYDELGSVKGVAVDVRELRDAEGDAVRGLLVDITESQYREERAFVDADEILELLNGFDALLAVQANPTPFKNFEVRYTTKGALQLTAFSSSTGGISYAVQAGQITRAQRFLDAVDMRKLRSMFAAAQTKLASLGPN